jgi:hypothetical protein
MAGRQRLPGTPATSSRGRPRQRCCRTRCDGPPGPPGHARSAGQATPPLRGLDGREHGCRAPHRRSTPSSVGDTSAGYGAPDARAPLRSRGSGPGASAHGAGAPLPARVVGPGRLRRAGPPPGPPVRPGPGRRRLSRPSGFDDAREDARALVTARPTSVRPCRSAGSGGCGRRAHRVHAARRTVLPPGRAPVVPRACRGLGRPHCGAAVTTG